METVTDMSLSLTDICMKTDESVVYAGILGNVQNLRGYWLSACANGHDGN